MAICSRGSPATEVKFPTATSCEPSGVTSILAMCDTPPLWSPLNGTAMS
jgi:hypothetical protein